VDIKMEEMSLKYAKIIVGFVIAVAISTFTLKNHIKSVTQAKQTTEVMQNMVNAVQNQTAENPEQTQEAVEIKQVQYAPENPEMQQEATLETSESENLYRREGLKKIGENDLDGAILIFEKIMSNENDSEKLASYKFLVHCYEQKGDSAGLINTYIRILPLIQDENEKKEVNEKLANAFLQVGNKEQALKCYEDNYAISHSVSDIIKIGDILMETGEKERLQTYIDNHLAMFPNDSYMLQKYIDWINPEQQNS